MIDGSEKRKRQLASELRSSRVFEKRGKTTVLTLTKRSPEVLPPLINSHSFMQTLANQKSRAVSSWLLIGLNLHERM